MRRKISLVALSIFALTVIGLAPILAPVASAATTIAATTTCSNGVDDTPGLGVICQVTIVNTITTRGSTARVTVRECHGAAGDPTASCRTTVRNLTRAVTRVTQCNAATNGGGGTLRCSVRITNRFIGVNIGRSAVTTNQCVGSGDGIANECDPFPATTSGAAITQCNGSANGGTLVQLKCTTSGTRSSRLPVTINQCNGSTNGGGALVICSASISNIVGTSTTTGGTTRTGTGGGAGLTPPPTDTSAATTTSSPSSPFTVIGLFLAVAFGLFAVTSRWSRSTRKH